MGVDDVRVDLGSLDDFARHLEPRLRDAVAALDNLTHIDRRPGHDSARPELGEFLDAGETADRYEELHQAHITRLQRLINAVVAAQFATGSIMTIYRTTEELNEAGMRAIGDLLSSSLPTVR